MGTRIGEKDAVYIFLEKLDTAHREDPIKCPGRFGTDSVFVGEEPT